MNGVNGKAKKKSRLTSKLNCTAVQDHVETDVMTNGHTEINGYHDEPMTNGHTLPSDGSPDGLYPLPTKTADSSSFVSSNTSRSSWNSAQLDTPDDQSAGHPKDMSHCRMKTAQEVIRAACVDLYQPTHQLGPDYIIPTDDAYATSQSGAVHLRITDQGPASKQPISIVTFMREVVETYPSTTALSVKRNNKWILWSYAKYWSDVRLAAKAFIKLGLERFHSVGILGFNSPEWFISNFAAIFSGGISTGIYATNSAEACYYVLDHSDTNIVIVENDIQLQKILKIRHRLPQLKAIIQYLGTPASNEVLSWEDLLEIGRTVPDEVLERRIRSLAINQCCTLIYTSGTTGNPKGVMLNHDNLVFSANFIIELWIKGHSAGKLVTYLPLSHIAAQISDVYTVLGIGGHIVFAQPDALKGTLVGTLKETCPKGFLGVPRVYEKMYEKIQEAEGQMSYLKRAALNWAKKCGYAYTESKMKGNPVVPTGYSLAERLLRKIHLALGFKNTNVYFCGAAPLSREQQTFFMSLAIIILECYGMSECSGPHIMNTLNHFRTGSVGKNSSFYQTKLEKPNAEGHGEICMRGRHVFMGYLKMEDKTLEALDADGFLHSGDIGCYDPDGFLYVTGRIKDILITAGGENVAPLLIEAVIKEELPFVNHAVLIGDRRKFLSVLLTVKTDVDFNTLGPLDTLVSRSLEWCRSIGSSARTVQEMLADPDKVIAAGIKAGIDRVNMRAISNAQKLQKWVILPQDFSIHGGELGPTLKIKRQVVYEKYKDTIEEFYRN